MTTSAEYQEETRALLTDPIMSAPREFAASLDRASIAFDGGSPELVPPSLQTMADLGFTSWHDRARALAERIYLGEDDDEGDDGCYHPNDEEPEEPTPSGLASDGKTRTYRSEYTRWVKASDFEALLVQLKAATSQASLVPLAPVPAPAV